jgi:hypothetical protein
MKQVANQPGSTCAGRWRSTNMKQAHWFPHCKSLLGATAMHNTEAHMPDLCHKVLAYNSRHISNASNASLLLAPLPEQRTRLTCLGPATPIICIPRPWRSDMGMGSWHAQVAHALKHTHALSGHCSQENRVQNACGSHPGFMCTCWSASSACIPASGLVTPAVRASCCVSSNRTARQQPAYCTPAAPCNLPHLHPHPCI